MNVAATRAYDFRVIPLALIDPPPTPMREAMDPEKLDELRRSVADIGVQSPLGVFQIGDRFRIIYGHRRYVAAGLAGETMVPCRVHEDGEAREEDYKLVENSLREEVNPAEEATWLADLLERKCGDSIEKLCRLVNRSESWVNGRLDLLRGDELVMQALRERRINLAVARELNKVKDDAWRRHFLGDAVEQGATASVVAAWRMNFERQQKLQAAEQRGDLAAVPPSTETPLTSVDHCLVCGLDADQFEMEYVRVHRSCHVQQRRLLRAAAGQSV